MWCVQIILRSAFVHVSNVMVIHPKVVDTIVLFLMCVWMCFCKRAKWDTNSNCCEMTMNKTLEPWDLNGVPTDIHNLTMNGQSWDIWYVSKLKYSCGATIDRTSWHGWHVVRESILHLAGHEFSNISLYSAKPFFLALSGFKSHFSISAVFHILWLVK